MFSWVAAKKIAAFIAQDVFQPIYSYSREIGVKVFIMLLE
jgi:hypothetical protein